MKKLPNKWKPNDIPEICKTIRKYRIKKHMTQKEVEYHCGIGDNTISLYECGKVIPRIDTIKIICKVLEIPKREIFGHLKTDLSQKRDAIEESVKALRYHTDIIAENSKQAKAHLSSLIQDLKFLRKQRLFGLYELARAVGIRSPYIISLEHRINSITIESIIKSQTLFEKASKFVNKIVNGIEGKKR